MTLEYSRNYYSGHPDRVHPLLKISMKIFMRRYKNVKIGITCNPEQRCKDHQKHAEGWERMIVKYETTSVRNANEQNLDNQWTGKSNMAPSPRYYVYFLLGGEIKQ